MPSSVWVEKMTGPGVPHLKVVRGMCFPCMVRVLAVDPAFTNLGLVLAESDASGFRVSDALRVDLGSLQCEATCELPHSGHVVDRVMHFESLYSHLFEGTDVIVAEQQPPGGGGECVGALLYYRWRSKTVLVSPATLHKHFGLRGHDYGGRKRLSVELATPHLSGCPAFVSTVRRHDMADACLLALYYHATVTLKPRPVREPNPPRVVRVADFSRFRFLGAV